MRLQKYFLAALVTTALQFDSASSHGQSSSKTDEILKTYYKEGVSYRSVGDQNRLALVARYNEFDLFDLSTMRVLTTVKTTRPYAYKVSDDGSYLAMVDYGVYEGSNDSRIKIYDLTKQYEEYDPEPVAKFYANLGINDATFFRWLHSNKYLLISGGWGFALFDIQNRKRVLDKNRFNGINSLNYSSEKRMLTVSDKKGDTTIDLSTFVTDVASPKPINNAVALDSKTRIDFLLNLAGFKKQEFNSGSVEILKNPKLQYTLSDETFDYFGSFDPPTGRVTYASRARENEIEFSEKIGKVKYFKVSLFKSSIYQNQYTEVSNLKSKFDGSEKLLFQDYRVENGNIIKSNDGNIHDIKGLQPIPNPVDAKSAFFRLSDGKILAVLQYGYEALTSKLYRDIGSSGVGGISRETETRYLTHLVVFSADGKTINLKKTYLFPQKFGVRIGTNGSFVIVATQTFKPELMQKLSVEVLKEFSDEKDGIAITFFDSDLVIKKFELIDPKKDSRIKNSRLIAITSNTSQLMVLFASNQTGSINEESLTANIYDLNRLSLERQLVNEQSLKVERYFDPTTSFFDGNIAYYVNSRFAGAGNYEYKGYKIDLSKSFQLEEVPITYFKVTP